MRPSSPLSLRLLGLSLLFFVATACSRKTRPSATPEPERPVTKAPDKPATNPAPSTNFPVPGPAPLSTYKTQIVVDGYGKVTANAANLPPEKADDFEAYALKARGFTPEQLKNLKARYNAIPPKVLFVPDGQWREGSKGRYYVLRKKFYYWQKSDGYFHLDDIYYL